METALESRSDPVGVAALVEAAGLTDVLAIDPETLTVQNGRNDNWLTRDQDGAGVFLKFLAGPDDESLARFQRSLQFEEATRDVPFSWWRKPEYLGGSREMRLLAYRAIAGETSAASMMRDDTFHTTLAERCGRAVAELHSLRLPGRARIEEAGASDTAPADPRRHDRGRTSGRGMFMALSLDEYAQASGAELEAWALLQHDRQLIGAMDALARRSATARQVACHGDLRLDQFLVRDDDLVIIDWEEFRPGDAAIDIGSFVGEWLHRAAWLMFSDLDSDPALSAAQIHEALVRRGERELDLVRPFIVAFWEGYRDQRKEADEGLATRSTAYAGWHLFDRMLAGSMIRFHLSHVERGMAGIGRTALLDPQEFADVIGLTRE